ncbi:MAG TPA: phospho-sugar mutase [Trebonia sp.]|nr:phospho-sugar mutase [Trebonia sp.]
MAVGAELRAKVEAWIAEDPDPVDRAELAALLDRASAPDEDPDASGPGGQRSAADELIALAASGDAEEAVSQLEDRFASRLTFGTAGLRCQIGAGPNRMNRAVVRAVTSAVAGWLADSVTSPASVVIGSDARHRSDEFADEVAQVLAGAGVHAYLLPRPSPTPVLAFAVRHLPACAGVMITASHNPRTDNGYKLYLSDGAQVIPPVDAEIEARMADLGPLLDIPTAPLDSPAITRLGEEVTDAYVAAISSRFAGTGETATGKTGTSETATGETATGETGTDQTGADEVSLKVVYTPLHGVAGRVVLEVLRRAGFSRPHVVTMQAQPDPDFPTAAFPNPEEPTALTLALADARALDADLMLANDPDGDRLAVAVPEPDTRRKIRNVPGTSMPEDGRWRVLNGDQVGALLGDYLLTQAGAGDPEARGAPRPLVATSIVSSGLLSKIAAKAGATYIETLTGFKWIARAADQVTGAAFAFGYEEAIGYAVGDVVRDKDGIGTALAFLRLATEAARAGRSVLDLYDELEREHGVHHTAQLSLHVTAAGEVMRRLRANPPARLAGRPIDTMTDYNLTGGAGGTSGTAGTSGTLTGLPPSDVLRFMVGDDRVVIRPSGTEPKIKAYLEIVEPVRPGGLIAARLAAQRRLTPLRQAVIALLARMATTTHGRGEA